MLVFLSVAKYFFVIIFPKIQAEKWDYLGYKKEPGEEGCESLDIQLASQKLVR